VPIEYKPGNPINATMWLTGLELFLLIDDPWKVFLTTDHPNAGTFSNYPQIIRLLMDRGYREEMVATLHPRARKGAALAELDREYSLSDIAVITRSGPARALGLKDKGHLGVGADADIAVYEEQADKEAMFARPRYVYKGGELVARDGAVIKQVTGITYSVAPDYDAAIEDDMRAHFKEAYTVSYDNYAMLSGDGARTETVACG
jgi:formylmethanofuran dehydrogenase subunit A